MVLILEVGVQFHNIGVIKLVMDSELSSELTHHVIFFYGRFEDFLQGEQTPG